jgi:hypothetical protein
MYVTVDGIHGCKQFWYDIFWNWSGWLSYVKYFFHTYVPVDVQVIYIFPCEPPNAIPILCDLTCRLATALYWYSTCPPIQVITMHVCAFRGLHMGEVTYIYVDWCGNKTILMCTAIRRIATQIIREWPVTVKSSRHKCKATVRKSIHKQTTWYL